MDVREQDIRDITGVVWSNVLSTEAGPAPPGPEPDWKAGALTSCVQLSGAWSGAVTLQSSMTLARTVAGVMFDTDPASASDDDVRDAIGELVNMIGGNLKALVPGPTHLSLPVVVEGTKEALSICDATQIRRVWFSSMGESFVVTMLSRGSERVSASGQRRSGPDVAR